MSVLTRLGRVLPKHRRTSRAVQRGADALVIEAKSRTRQELAADLERNYADAVELMRKVDTHLDIQTDQSEEQASNEPWDPNKRWEDARTASLGEAVPKPEGPGEWVSTEKMETFEPATVEESNDPEIKVASLRRPTEEVFRGEKTIAFAKVLSKSDGGGETCPCVRVRCVGSGAGDLLSELGCQP